MTPRRIGARAAALAGAVLLCGCSMFDDSPTPATSSPQASVTATPSGSAAPVTPQERVRTCLVTTLADLAPPQRIGQLLMVGVPADDPKAARATAKALVSELSVGSFILTGRSDDPLPQVGALTEALHRIAAAAGPGALVAVDQEGGQVRVLQGKGFGDMPSAVEQGALPPAQLSVKAGAWAGALARAGIDVNLAPVADVVPAGSEAANAPIGRYDRQYGSDPGAVAKSVRAFVIGMEEGDVAATVKHFPGLGRVTGNTDTTADVHDTVTTVGDQSLLPFRVAIGAGVPLVMVSSATYDKIDPTAPAVYSAAIIRGTLRSLLRFRGVVVSDDVGSALSAASLPLRKRGTAFVSAGGDLVLTVDPATARQLSAGLLAAYQASAPFRAKVDASVLRILGLKLANHRLTCP